MIILNCEHGMKCKEKLYLDWEYFGTKGYLLSENLKNGTVSNHTGE